MLFHFAALVWAQGADCQSTLERAQTAYQAKQYSSAAVDFERAEKVCLNSTRVLLPLAQAQLLSQQLEPSLASLSRLLKTSPRNLEALKLQGDVLYLLGRDEAAVESLQTAIEVDPKHEAARYALGRIFYQQNRLEAAIEQFRTLVEQNPANYRAHDNLALCYAAQNRDSDALRHFLKALDLVHKDHPEYDVAYADAANFFMERNDNEKGFQLAAEAAQRNPDSARNFFLAGKALVKLSKTDLSVRWLRRSTELDPDYPEARYWLARAYRELGRDEVAEKELAKFRELSQNPRPKR